VSFRHLGVSPSKAHAYLPFSFGSLQRTLTTIMDPNIICLLLLMAGLAVWLVVIVRQLAAMEKRRHPIARSQPPIVARGSATSSGRGP
jgi:hypothetical protein